MVVFVVLYLAIVTSAIVISVIMLLLFGKNFRQYRIKINYRRRKEHRSHDVRVLVNSNRYEDIMVAIELIRQHNLYQYKDQLPGLMQNDDHRISVQSAMLLASMMDKSDIETLSVYLSNKNYLFLLNNILGVIRENDRIRNSCVLDTICLLASNPDSCPEFLFGLLSYSADNNEQIEAVLHRDGFSQYSLYILKALNKRVYKIRVDQAIKEFAQTLSDATLLYLIKCCSYDKEFILEMLSHKTWFIRSNAAKLMLAEDKELLIEIAKGNHHDKYAIDMAIHVLEGLTEENNRHAAS